MQNTIPTFDSMMNPLLRALHELGGSGTIDEINYKTIELLNLPDEITEIPHGEKGYRSEIEYRLAWARTYLKKYGLIDNSNRGIWSLTGMQDKPITISPKEVTRSVRETDRRSKELSQNPGETDIEKEDTIEDWKEETRNILYAISPSQFERLTQRLLRESGFTQVEVTGKSGDGGIDGKGIIKIGGLISFHAMFQCKRYKDTVTASNIRDFRGALQGRADKGLFVTTGTFTRDAVKEAHRDGAPPIDLIDGDEFVEKLKELSLGVKTELIEQVTVLHDWFEKI